MATIIGYDEKVKKCFTCFNCGAIVEYVPHEDQYINRTDEGTKIKGLECPGCKTFHRTNQ